MRTFAVIILTLMLAGCGGAADDLKSRAETDAVVNQWIDAWLAGDHSRLAALYAEDGTYEDDAYPFVRVGRERISRMVRDHLSWTTYTVADPVEVEYTEDGAIVRWIWAGTHAGVPFSMDAQTTFVIDDGLITHSTDSYARGDAPWS